jgi:hypothetical protein
MGVSPRYVLRSSLLVGAACGTGAGAVVAALRAAQGQSLTPALVIGVVAATLAAPAAAVAIVEQTWPGLAELRFRDRRAVVRAVRDGKPFDPRLAPAVLGYAVHTRRALERLRARPDRRWLRTLSVALAVAGFTITATLGDSSPTHLFFFGAGVLYVVAVAVYLPYRHRQVTRNADRAATAAALDQDQPAPATDRSRRPG